MLWRINREKSHIRSCSLSQLAGALPQPALASSERCSAAVDFALAAHSNTLSFLCSCFLLNLLSTGADYTPFPSLVLTVCCREGGCTLQLDMSQKLLSQQRTFSPVCIYQTQRGNTLVFQLWWIWIIYLLKLFVSVCPALPVSFWGHSGNKGSVITVSVCSAAPLCDQVIVFIPVPVIFGLSLCWKRFLPKGELQSHIIRLIWVLIWGTLLFRYSKELTDVPVLLSSLLQSNFHIFALWPSSLSLMLDLSLPAALCGVLSFLWMLLDILSIPLPSLKGQGLLTHLR